MIHITVLLLRFYRVFDAALIIEKFGGHIKISNAWLSLH